MATPQPEDIFAPVLHTERLTLTLYQMNDKDDSDFMAKMMNVEMPGAGPQEDGVWTPQGVRKLCYSVMPKPSDDPRGRLSKDAPIYVVHLGGEASGPRIGVINLCRRVPNVPLDLGYMIVPEHRRCGYASEASARLLRYYTEEYGLKEICLVIDEKNTASRKTAEKLGTVDGGYVMMGGAKEVVYVLPGMKKLEGEEFTFWGDGEDLSV